MIIGSGGSGKSTFSHRLGEIKNLPVYHLDSYYWRPDWKPTPNEEWDHFIEELVKHKDWIIDGNYGRTMDLRLKEANAVFYFDLPSLICIYRIIKRRFHYIGKTRPDMGEGCTEKLDWEFVKWVWRFKKNNRQGILRKLEKYRGEKEIHIFRKPSQVSHFLKK